MRSRTLQVPQTIDEIDAQWLGRVLRGAGVRAPLAAVECQPIGGQKGFLSSTVAAALRYAELTGRVSSLQNSTRIPEYDHFWDRGLADHWPRFAREYELRIGREGVRLGERVVRWLEWLEARIAERRPEPALRAAHRRRRAAALLIRCGARCGRASPNLEGRRRMTRETA